MYYLVIFDLGFDFYALDYESILQIWDVFLLVVLLLLLTGNLNKIKKHYLIFAISVSEGAPNMKHFIRTPSYCDFKFS